MLLEQAQRPGEVPRYVNLLLYGGFGVGKTYLSATAPSPLILDFEGGTLGVPESSEAKILRPGLKELDPLMMELQGGSHPFKTLVVDSLTELQRRVMDALIFEEYDRSGGRRDPDFATLQDWGRITQRCRRLVRYLRDLPMHVVFVALEQEVEKDGVMTVVPALPPKLLVDVCGFVDVVARLTCHEVESGVTRYLHTAPSPMFVAKDRSGKLPPHIESPDLASVFAMITS